MTHKGIVHQPVEICAKTLKNAACSKGMFLILLDTSIILVLSGLGGIMGKLYMTQEA